MGKHAAAVDRRAFLRHLGALSAVLAGVPRLAAAFGPETIVKTIPAGGERIPAIGMGTWITFDVGEDALRRAVRLEVLRTFFAQGGGMIDASPMYGSAEEVIGWCLDRLGRPAGGFAATKVWTVGRAEGRRQMETSRRLWGVPRFDLLQVHNLLDWQAQLETLKAMKAEGALRYIGVTTSHGRRHEELERVMRQEPLDFVQFTYNLADREAEQRLLPLAAERGMAVIANRPLQGGALFRRARNRPLPAWALEIDCANWAQFFLKFVVSHPAVTCAIPATSRVEHMAENMGAARGALPDRSMRQRMAEHFASL